MTRFAWEHKHTFNLQISERREGMKIALWLVRMELFFPFILILWGREIQGVGSSQYSKPLKGTVVPPSFYSTLKKKSQ